MLETFPNYENHVKIYNNKLSDDLIQMLMHSWKSIVLRMRLWDLQDKRCTMIMYIIMLKVLQKFYRYTNESSKFTTVNETWSWTNDQLMAETLPNYDRVFEIHNIQWNDDLVPM